MSKALTYFIFQIVYFPELLFLRVRSLCIILGKFYAKIVWYYNKRDAESKCVKFMGGVGVAAINQLAQGARNSRAGPVLSIVKRIENRKASLGAV